MRLLIHPFSYVQSTQSSMFIKWCAMFFPIFKSSCIRSWLPLLLALLLHLLAIGLFLNPEKPQAKTHVPKVLLTRLVASPTSQTITNKVPQRNVKAEVIAKSKPIPKTEPQAKPKAQAEILKQIPAPDTEQKQTTEVTETIITEEKKETDYLELKHIPDKAIETSDDTKASEDTVVTAIQVDARSTQNHPPVYPKLSKRLKEEGTVTLSLLISYQGRIEEISIHESSGYSRLDKAALSAAAKWRYEPATVNGIAIAQHYLMPIEFKLNTLKR